MHEQGKSAPGWRHTLRHELIEYAFNVVYLTLVFAAFTWYRRLLLSAYQIEYADSWIAVIEGHVLGKVIMIAKLFGFGRHLEGRPLIYPTLYKSVVFSLFVLVFKLAELTVRGLIKGEGIAGGIDELARQGLPITLANSIVVLVAIIPFVAVKELGRTLGENRVAKLFFGERAAR